MGEGERGDYELERDREQRGEYVYRTLCRDCVEILRPDFCGMLVVFGSRNVTEGICQRRRNTRLGRSIPDDNSLKVQQVV